MARAPIGATSGTGRPNRLPSEVDGPPADQRPSLGEDATTATAEAPIRNRSGAGALTRILTGNRCATCTQLIDFGTFGNPSALPPSSGRTPQPTESTTPSNLRSGSIIRYTRTVVPGRIRGNSVSRKFATTYHVRVSINVKSDLPTDANSPSAMSRFTTRPSKGARTTVCSSW